MAKKKTSKKTGGPLGRSKPARGSQAANEAKKKAAAKKKPASSGGSVTNSKGASVAPKRTTDPYGQMSASEFKKKFPGVPLSRAKYGVPRGGDKYGYNKGPGAAPKSGNARRGK